LLYNLEKGAGMPYRRMPSEKVSGPNFAAQYFDNSKSQICFLTLIAYKFNFLTKVECSFVGDGPPLPGYATP